MIKFSNSKIELEKQFLILFLNWIYIYSIWDFYNIYLVLLFSFVWVWLLDQLTDRWYFNRRREEYFNPEINKIQDQLNKDKK